MEDETGDEDEEEEYPEGNFEEDYIEYEVAEPADSGCSDEGREADEEDEGTGVEEVVEVVVEAGDAMDVDEVKEGTVDLSLLSSLAGPNWIAPLVPRGKPSMEDVD